MRVEIPTFTRCCGCLPLRRGIIILGYLSLVYVTLFLMRELQVNEDWTTHTIVLFRGAGFIVEKWLPVILYCFEIAFILALLVGAHTERPHLMRIYYYYGVTTTVAALAIGIITLSMRTPDDFDRFFTYVVDLSTILIGIGTEVYLLLLIRSELRKPQESLRYVNQRTEICIQPPVRRNDLSFL